MIGLIPLGCGVEGSVPAASPLVAKIGRFDSPQSGAERCSWSGSAVELKVRGTSLTASIDDTGDNYLEVEINGEQSQSLHLQGGVHDYTINFTAPSTIRLVKRTESFVGTVTFISFSTDPSGSILADKAPKRLIQFVGDSITCGYGNEGASEQEHFKSATENADMSYAWIAARDLHAQAEVIAWSGRKMWPDNTTPEIYDYVIPTDTSTKLDFSSHQKPDVILINLATNDFGKDNPDRAKWCAAYEAFIGKLRSLYPKAYIYCAIGSMMSDNWPPNHMALTTVRQYIDQIVSDENTAGDHRVAKIEFEMQKQSDGLGSDYHPSLKTDGIMADKLVARIKQDLGW